MAKLSKGNLAAQSSVSSSKVDDWNPPVMAPASSTAALMLPPKSRPLPRLPTTPSQKSMTISTNSEGQNSSSKKKRRRRGGKRNGDSASEVTTNISEDVVKDATPPAQEAPEVLVPASQSSISALPPNASAEEIRIFQNEPELYGVYASSDGEEEHMETEDRSDMVPPPRRRTPAYSPSIAAGVVQSSPARNTREHIESLPLQKLTKSRAGADVVLSEQSQIPNPKKMANGRFKCPLAAQYDCTQTFAQPKGARRHAEKHLNADRFKCDHCGKGYSRKDLLTRHLKSAHDQTSKGAGVGKSTNARSDHTRSNGAANIQSTQESRGDTVSAKDASDEESVSAAPPIVNGASRHANELAYLIDSSELDTENKNERSTVRKQGLNNEGHTSAQRNASVGSSDAVNSPSTQVRKTDAPHDQRSPQLKKQSSQVDGDLKRKRTSPHDSTATKSQVRKRVRRDRNIPTSSFQHVNVLNPTSSAVKLSDSPVTAESRISEDSDVEMNGTDDQDQVIQSNAGTTADSVADVGPNTDVAMTDHDRENAPGSENAIPVQEDGSVTEEEEDDEEEEEQEDSEDHSDDTEEEEDQEARSAVEPPSLRKSHTNTTKESFSGSQRQSSMDSFVQRSKSASTSARVSGSGSRISVDVPVRSKAQSKITPHISVSASRSTQQTDDSPANSENEEQPTRSTRSADLEASGDEVRRKRNKGKGRARSEEPEKVTDIEEMEEETSSDDRPKATTVARRTSSVASKSTPRLKNRPIVRKEKKRGTDSDGPEPIEKAKSKSQGKPRKPSKKKTKAPAAGDSSEEGRSKRQKSAYIAGSTWAEASKSGVTGKFTEKEIRILHAWRDSFCEENNLTAYEFNEMMANTASVNRTDWRYGNWITKADFMQQYYEQLPYRNRRSMIRFRERHFQNADSSPWTEAHDKELRQLVSELGTKWVEIAQIMGRTQDSVSQRWRHKLNYGEKPALMGEWTEKEVKRLEAEVVAFAQMKNTTPDDDDLHIPWNAISKKLGNGRTAQQCSNRWRINTSKRVNGKFVKVPHNDRIPGEKVHKPRTPSKMEQRLSGQTTPKSGKVYKSAERIEDSDAEDGEEQDEVKDKDDDADDESEPKEKSEAESEEEEEASDDDEEEEPEAEADEDQKGTEDQQSGEHTESDSEEADVNSESQADLLLHEELSTVPSTQELGALSVKKESSGKAKDDAPRGFSSSQPSEKTTFHTSQAQSSSSSSSSSQPPPSSLPATFKTPAVSRNPLRRANLDHTTPGNGLSLTQLHAGTQANSSAKRTTGRTNRTRVPDSVLAENRPSPRLDLRRRPVRSSSPSMTPISDVAPGAAAVDEEEEEETSSGGSSSEDIETDFKSPTSFVSARDSARRSAEEHSSTEDDSDSDSTSDADQPAQPSRSTAQDSSSTFWQSVNQNLRKLTGLSQSQSQSQGLKGRVSLADVLRRGAVEASDSDDDDD